MHGPRPDERLASASAALAEAQFLSQLRAIMLRRRARTPITVDQRGLWHDAARPAAWADPAADPQNQPDL